MAHKSPQSTRISRMPLSPDAKSMQGQTPPRPIGITATGKPTAKRGAKDAVDEASESSFPASDPPANSTIAAGEVGTASGSDEAE